jgi:hypothetical protein
VLVALSFLVACGREETRTVVSTPQPTVDVLKRDLRTIMSAQEGHFSRTGTYAATLDILRASGAVELASGGTVQMVGKPNAFTIAITKAVGPGASVQCGVEVGSGTEHDGMLECR